MISINKYYKIIIIYIMSDISNNIKYPEEWDDIIKLMSYEDISKINSGFIG